MAFLDVGLGYQAPIGALSFGACWVRAPTVERPSVTEVRRNGWSLPSAHAAGRTRLQLGLRSRRSGLRVKAADRQQPTAVGTSTTAEESWRIVGGSGPIHLLSPAAFHRSLPISTPPMYRPVRARWI
jgi:hypothetical protein